jgi:hypothetical protein
MSFEETMTKYHACVWIDQRHAKVYEIGMETMQKLELSDTRPNHHLHRRADHVGLGTIEMNPAFLADVAKAIERAKAILILGPGKARVVLGGYLQEHFPKIANRVWATEPCDHPTDAELVARARDFFRSADRMHALGEGA